jgi:ribonuclease Y
MDIALLIIIISFLLALFFYLGWYFNSKVGKKSILSAEKRAEQIIADAQKEANSIKKEKLLEVKDEWYKKKVEFDNEVNQKRQKIANLEKQLSSREENVEKKYDLILLKEKDLKKLEKDITELKINLDKRSEEVKKLEAEQNEKLEKISGMTSEDAKKILIENMISSAKSDSSQMIKEIYEKAKAEAKKEAQKIVVQAIQRTAADHSIETTVSVVQIQNDEMKGRIIGKEGRNIRAFESSTGVDVIVDDTPEAVILSSFDQFRREIARISLERLIADGRIHPARIEEIVQKTQTNLKKKFLKKAKIL